MLPPSGKPTTHARDDAPLVHPYAHHHRWRRVVLETSLKPFAGEESFAAAGRRLFQVWAPLVNRAEVVAVLLWVADGSEILEWSGDLHQRLEWGRYIGFNNSNVRPDLYYPGWYHNRTARPFRWGLPTWTYAELQAIIAGLRLAAREAHGMDLEVGATFDPGPEFARSRFKYRWHPEVLFPQEDDEPRAPIRFVTCQATLHADGRRYGAYPDGIPEGESLGTFLGRQFRSLAQAVGFDYLWLSNGFGYSHFAWTQTGELFQRGVWRPERAGDQRRRTLHFWQDFRRACPEAAVEVRGTNFSVGMDLATDGADHQAILAEGRLEVMPPNLPVLHADLLAEDIVTYLSRQAKSPTTRIIYRTYLNDPWFEQNPWYDIYNREPLETYTAMSTARLNDEGGVDTPTDLHLLTVDTERGDWPADEALEVIPHYQRALEERADAPGPLVWVYPSDEYHQVLRQQPHLLSEVFFHDHFLTRAVDGGLPLLTVCSSDRFVRLQQAGRLPDAVFLAPAPLGRADYAEALVAHVGAGGQGIFYGSLAHAPAAVWEALQVQPSNQALSGAFAVENRLTPDRFATLVGNCWPQARLSHDPATGGKGFAEICSDWDDPEVRIVLEQDGNRRVGAVVRALPGGGKLGWIRGVVPYGRPCGPPWFRLPRLPQADRLRSQDWLRRLVAEFGWDILQQRGGPDTEPVRLFLKRCRGAWYFVGSKPDTSVHALVRTPFGAPVFTEYDTPLRDGYAEEHFGKTLYNEVRFFVKQDSGVVKVKSLSFGPMHQRCLHLSGCRHAKVTIFPDPPALRAGKVLVLSRRWGDLEPPGQSPDSPQVPCRADLESGSLVVDDFTGELFVKW